MKFKRSFEPVLQFRYSCLISTTSFVSSTCTSASRRLQECTRHLRTVTPAAALSYQYIFKLLFEHAELLLFMWDLFFRHVCLRICPHPMRSSRALRSLSSTSGASTVVSLPHAVHSRGATHYATGVDRQKHADVICTPTAGHWSQMVGRVAHMLWRHFNSTLAFWRLLERRHMQRWGFHGCSWSPT